jgi:hypothetical protein
LYEITGTKSDAKNRDGLKTRRYKCQPGSNPGFKRIQHLLNQPVWRAVYRAGGPGFCYTEVTIEVMQF